MRSISNITLVKKLIKISVDIYADIERDKNNYLKKFELYTKYVNATIVKLFETL